MDEKRILDKLESMTDKLNDQAVVLARHTFLHEKNTEDLAEHIKRTNALETKQEAHEVHVHTQMSEALLPIKSFKFLTKLAGGMLTLAAVLKLTGLI